MNKKKLAPALITGVLTIALAGQVLAAPVNYGEELKNSPQTTPSISFTDVTGNHWAYRYIAEMVNKKVIEGYPDNKFRPENTISRAEFATIIVKAAGLQAKKVNYSRFSDVKTTDWYSPYIETVSQYMTGFRTADGQYIFNPTAPALREDITVAMVKLKGYDVARLANRSVIEAMFKDYDGISESAKDFVSIAVANGLVSGYEDETFRAQNSITRAEAATMLWRAFMYGNDNKGVGGQEDSSTPTTPSVTQPSTPKPTTPTQPQQPSQAAKFSVDTLVGGLGKGDVDGPVSMAKINEVSSIVTDKDDNIYFLDGDKNKVRKFNKSNGNVETITLKDNNIDSKFPLDKSGYVIMRYNPVSNKLYLAVSSSSSSQIYEISSTVSLATYSQEESAGSYHFISFMAFQDAEHLVYGYSTDGYTYQNYSHLISSTLPNRGNLLGRNLDNNAPTFGATGRTNIYASKVDAIATNDDIWIFDTYSSILTKTHIFPRKIETIKKFENLTFESVVSYNGKFYASGDSTIYEISQNGQISIFIDGKDLTYNDGNPINIISHMSFDSNGNVIVYDDENKAIRRINL
ncbi:S-layer homology domain-containing protein [Paenibacillus puerhi]|uniref:S-layer homology domain-containing protein n=1 Tax=Paenibacillus puerhi TaxID=2692622 RepID=UPI00135753C5|nr:S-layer homology domain-containing protein [Paenibacillus puerhi]